MTELDLGFEVELELLITYPAWIKDWNCFADVPDRSTLIRPQNSSKSLARENLEDRRIINCFERMQGILAYPR